MANTVDIIYKELSPESDSYGCICELKPCRAGPTPTIYSIFHPIHSVLVTFCLDTFGKQANIKVWKRSIRFQDKSQAMIVRLAFHGKLEHEVVPIDLLQRYYNG